MLYAMAGLSSPVQVVISPAERLPGWVGATNAVIAVSCSGSTPETLAIATEAARRGCHSPALAPREPTAPDRRTGPGPVRPGCARRARAVDAVVGIRPAAGDRRGDGRGRDRLRRLRAGGDPARGCRTSAARPANHSSTRANRWPWTLVGALPMVWGTSALSTVRGAQVRQPAAGGSAKYPAISGMLPEAAHGQVAAFDGPFAPRSSRLSAQESGPARTTGRPARLGPGLRGHRAVERLHRAAADPDRRLR